MKHVVESIEAKILKAIYEYNMFKNVDEVIIGVSGGADSMALLFFLNKYLKSKNIKIIVAHVNHGIREEAQNDSQVVKNAAKSFGLDFKLLKVDIKKEAKLLKMGEEAAGRLVRYNFFNSVSQSQKFKIATAHTLSDSVETILLNMARGCSLKGLTGVNPVFKNLIRPLVYLSRKEVELFCEYNGINFVTDSTNFDRCYNRNKIRLDVIPTMKIINEKFEDNVFNMTKLLEQDEQYLNQQAEEAKTFCSLGQGRYSTSKINSFHPAVASRCIKKIIDDSFKTQEVTKDHTTAQSLHITLALKCIKDGYGFVNLPKGKRLIVKSDVLYVQDKVIKPPPVLVQPPVQADENTTNVLLTELGKQVIIKELPYSDIKSSKKVLTNDLISKTLFKHFKKELLLRNKRPGDVYLKAGRGVKKSLKKFLCEQKVTQELRDKLVLLARGKEVLWLEGFGASEYAKYDVESKEKAIYIKVLEGPLC